MRSCRPFAQFEGNNNPGWQHDLPPGPLADRRVDTTVQIRRRLARRYAAALYARGRTLAESINSAPSPAEIRRQPSWQLNCPIQALLDVHVFPLARRLDRPTPSHVTYTLPDIDRALAAAVPARARAVYCQADRAAPAIDRVVALLTAYRCALAALGAPTPHAGVTQ